MHRSRLRCWLLLRVWRWLLGRLLRHLEDRQLKDRQRRRLGNRLRNRRKRKSHAARNPLEAKPKPKPLKKPPTLRCVSVCLIFARRATTGFFRKARYSISPRLSPCSISISSRTFTFLSTASPLVQISAHALWTALSRDSASRARSYLRPRPVILKTKTMNSRASSASPTSLNARTATLPIRSRSRVFSPSTIRLEHVRADRALATP